MKGTGTAALPVKLTDWGLSGALSVIVSAAFTVPGAEAVKVTVMVQLDPAARIEAQSFFSPKELAPLPVTAMLVRVRARLPGLLKVTV